MTTNPETDITADEIAAETANLRALLAAGGYPIDRLHRGIADLTAGAARNEAEARDADAEADHYPEAPDYAQQWRDKARAHRRAALIAHARADLIRDRITTLTARSHVHRFTAHPETGKVICTCGLTEIAARTLDPDFVSSCCGMQVAKLPPNAAPYARGARTTCVVCLKDSTLIHLDQWQPEVCAACGRTSAEAGSPSNWTFHWRTKHSSTMAAQSCGGDCAVAVEARRNAKGVLRTVAKSINGHVKADPPQ